MFSYYTSVEIISYEVVDSSVAEITGPSETNEPAASLYTSIVSSAPTTSLLS